MAKALDKKKQEMVYDLLEKGYIRFTAIVEMLGAPKDYLKKTLKGYIEKLKQNPNLKVLNEYYAKPKKHDKLFTIFVELDMMAKNASELAFFCFDYMPSSIEINEPEKLIYNAPDFAAFFNDMVAKMHKLDAIMKNLKAKSANLERNAGLLLRNNIMIVLKYNKDLDLKELSKKVGIPEHQLSPFLEKLISENWIKRTKDKYNLKK